jgi:serpin B
MFSRKALCLVAVLAGCGWIPAAEIASAPQAPEDPLILSVAQSSTGFAADLYAQLRRQPGNITFAPLALSQALLPLAAGAQGRTGEELAKALHLTVPVTEAADGLSALTRRLQRAAGGAARLDFTRAVWVQQWNAINTDYIELLRQHCRSELRVIDFARAEHAAHWINRWVSDSTEDRIQAIADATSFEPESCLLVGNAVYFQVEWKDDFDPAQTALVPFRVPEEPAVSAPVPTASEPAAAPAATGESAATVDTTAKTNSEAPSAPASVVAEASRAPVAPVVEVPTMRRVAAMRLATEPGFRLIQLPYRGGHLSMVVLLPETDTALSKIEEQLTAERIVGLLRTVRTAEPVRVELRLPRFRSERPVAKLGAALESMGARTAFDRTGADFSALGANIDGEPIYLSSVSHLVKLSVDEQGVAAQAATLPAAQVPYDVPVEAPAPFFVDRPFLYFICDQQTGGLLFMGRIVDPRAG